MPYIISDSRRGVRVLAIAIALALAAITSTAPAHAARIANPYDCTPQPTLSSAFAPWSDYGPTPRCRTPAWKQGSTGWTLSGSAAVTAATSRGRSAAASHANSLEPPARLVGHHRADLHRRTYPYFRLFAKAAATGKNTLKIDVLFYDARATSSPKRLQTTSQRRPRGSRQVPSRSASSHPRRRSPQRPSGSASRPSVRPPATRSTTSTSTRGPAAELTSAAHRLRPRDRTPGTCGVRIAGSALE